MMKFVQLAILAALVLVAVLLGLNLMNDRGAPPAETPIASPASPDAVSSEAGTSASLSTPPADVAAPAQQPAEASAAPKATIEHPSPAPKPAAAPKSANAPKPTSAPRPSPSGVASPSHTAAATPASERRDEHREVARVDPPSAMPEAHSSTGAPAPATSSSTERYELMRPDSATPRPTSSHAAAPARTVTIPAGTILTIRTVQALSTKSNAAGDTFSGTLDQPLVVEDMVIAERGSRVEGKVAEVTESGRVKGVAQIAIALTKINTSDGQTADIGTQNFVVEAEKSTKSDATRVGIATGIGAALGAIFGGGKGAAIGAATGGAAGAGTVLVTKGKPAEIPSETRINFRLDRPLVITEKINTK